MTAALSTTSAVSPARVSIYTNKRAALASPAKFGTERQKDKGNHPFASKISPSAVRKQEFDRTMEEMECSREEDKATRKPKMAPLEKLVNKEEQESSAKEAARLARIKMKGEHYDKIARVKVVQEFAKKQGGHHQARGDNEEEDTDNEGIDPGGIYSRQSNENNGSFSYHKSEATSDDKDEEEFDKGASGCSPLLMGRYEPDNAFEEEPFDWLKEVDSRDTYDKKDLLIESTNQTFPCIACKS